MRLEITRPVFEVLAGFLGKWRRVQLGIRVVIVAINAHDGAARTRRGRQEKTVVVRHLLAELIHTHDTVRQRLGGDLRLGLARRNVRTAQIVRVGPIEIGVLIGPLRRGHTWTTDGLGHKRHCVTIDRRVVPTISKQVIVAGSLAVQLDVLPAVTEWPEQERPHGARRMLDSRGDFSWHNLVHP
ncbi:hypothetical protein D3C71_1238260 [compost metagenome]